TVVVTVPSPLAGEGSMVRPQDQMGEGAFHTPHPFFCVEPFELPSPAVEVGSIRLRPSVGVAELGQARVRVGEGTRGAAIHRVSIPPARLRAVVARMGKRPL